jgi:MFS family permease
MAGSAEVVADNVYDLGYANRTLFLFAGFAIFVMYVESMLTPSLPVIASDFGVSASQVSLVLSMYLVGGVAMNPIVGKLGDIYGKKRVFTYVLMVYAASVTVTGFAPNFDFLIVSRTVQGIGLTMFPLAMSIIREEFPREMIPRAQGILSGMFGAGFAVGLPIGAYLSNYFGWRATYHTALPLAIVFAFLISTRVRESRIRSPESKLDYPGALVLAISLGSIVMALSQGSSWGWTSPSVLGLMAVGLILLIPLVQWERRAPEPVLDLRLLGMRNVLVSNVSLMIAGLGMFLTFQAVIYKLELPTPVGAGFSILTTGISVAPIALVMMVVAPIGGILVSKIGVKPISVLGSAIGCIGFLFSAVASSTPQLLESMVFFSAGIGLIMVSTVNLLVMTVDPKEMGLATSMNTVFRTLGSSLGAPIAGSLISTYTTWVFEGYYNGTPIFYSSPSSLAFVYSFYIAAFLFLMAGFVALLSDEVLGGSAKPAASNPEV